MPEAILLERAGVDDVPAIRTLTRDAYASWAALIGREPLPMTADYARAVRDHRIDLLRQGGELLGLIEMILESDHLLIENVAIRPDCQGRGLGGRLLAHAEAVARAEGYATIRLYTNKLFEKNIALYARRGYRLEREEPIPGAIKVWMSKTVSGAP